MSSVRLEQQYLRLWDLFEGKQQITTLQKLSEHMYCSRRHMRALLQMMEKRGWIRWDSGPVRGKQSHLTFLSSGHTFRQRKAIELLEKDKFQQAIQLVGDRADIKEMVLAHLGQTYRQGKHILRILYYRPMSNLLPGTPLRRTQTHIVRQIFNGVTCINEENGEVEPDLAHHWQQLPPVLWRFWIRPGVRFHNRRELLVKILFTLYYGYVTSLPYFQRLQKLTRRCHGL